MRLWNLRKQANFKDIEVAAIKILKSSSLSKILLTKKFYKVWLFCVPFSGH